MSDPDTFYLYRPAGGYVLGSWDHFVRQKQDNTINAYYKGVWTATTNAATRLNFNGITMNTIADQPNRREYKCKAIVTGLRFSSGNRYSGSVTASRKQVERVTADTVFLMTDNFKDVTSGSRATPVSVTETRLNLMSF